MPEKKMCLSIAEVKTTKFSQSNDQRHDFCWLLTRMVASNIYVRIHDESAQLRLSKSLPWLTCSRLLRDSHSHWRLPPIHRQSTFVVVAACPPNNEQKFYHESTKIFGGVSGRAFKNSSTGTDASILLYRSVKNRFSYRSRIFGLKKVVQFEFCVTTYQLDRRHTICLGLAHHVALERR